MRRAARSWIASVAVMLLCICLAPRTPDAAEAVAFNHAAVGRTALEQHIRPAFQNLTTAFGQLRKASEACRGNDRYDFADLKPAFREAVRAWGRAAHLNIGPLAQNNRYERIYFWLDRKGIARRQVARALRRRPEAYLDPAELGERSIGVQGLPAFEQVMLLKPDDAGDAEFRCRYAIAIAGNLERIASRVAAAWAPGGDWGRWWLAPGSDNPRFLTADETTFALVRAFIVNTERVRDVELLRPLGFNAHRRKLPGPFDSSGLTMPFIAARIAGLRSLMVDGGLAREVKRIAKGRNLDDALQSIEQAEFELKHLETLSTRLAAVMSFFESDRVNEAVGLGFPLKSARVRAETAFALTTDLPVGFNASDGD